MSGETDTVLVMLTVPADWKKLSEVEIARKLRGNEPYLSLDIAKEIKRWANTSALDLAGLQRFIDERTGGSHV